MYILCKATNIGSVEQTKRPCVRIQPCNEYPPVTNSSQASLLARMASCIFLSIGKEERIFSL